MKISAREGEEGYTDHLFRVELNGRRIKDVAKADEEAGTLHQYVRDEDGQHVIDQTRRVAVLAEIRGRVQVFKLDQRRSG